MTQAVPILTLPHMDHFSGPTGLGLAELLEALASSDAGARAEAIARARLQSGVEEVLIGTLSDPAPEVRAAVVRALARMRGQRGTEALIQVSAGDVSVLVRAEAVAALGRILQERTPRPEDYPPDPGTGTGS